jgi:CO/xanthine dehydrogenase Mo-binding subunit
MGARSIGEIPILTIAPAIGNAVRDAVGIRMHGLPVTSEKIFNGLKSRHKSL